MSALYIFAVSHRPFLGAATFDSATKLFDCTTCYTVVCMYVCTPFWLYTYNYFTGSGSMLGTGSYRMSVQSFPTAQFLGVSFALGILPLPKAL